LELLTGTLPWPGDLQLPTGHRWLPFETFPLLPFGRLMVPALLQPALWMRWFYLPVAEYQDVAKLSAHAVDNDVVF
jgi:hypothetical protein